MRCPHTHARTGPHRWATGAQHTARLGHSWDSGRLADLGTARLHRRDTAMTCADPGGRGRYRTADRWCVNPSLTVHRVSLGAIPSSNAQVSGWFLSAVSTECRAVFARLGALLAQRGFSSLGVRSRWRGELAFRCQAARSTYLLSLPSSYPFDAVQVSAMDLGSSLREQFFHIPVTLRGLAARTGDSDLAAL